MFYQFSSRMYPRLTLLILCLTFLTVLCERVCEPQSGPCPGDRARLPVQEGCCPARAGEACGEDVGVFCDTELGYRCLDENKEEGRGTCQGTYALQAVTIQQKQLTIQWKPFAPVNYNLEYSLLYRQDNYSEDLSTWTNFECGDETEYTLLKLKPAAWYFIRLGIWNLPFNNTYSILTETLMIKTKDAEYCRHAGNEYEVGQVFNNNNEDKCLCLKTGKLACTSLCPNSSNEACQVKTSTDCSTLNCDTVFANCSVNGTVYIHNEAFDDGCKECTCNNGQATCILPSNCEEMEATEECPHPISHTIEGQCCPEWECGEPRPTSCEYKNRSFTEGHEWQDEETCEICRCFEGQITCHNFCEEPEVPKDCARPNRRPAPNGCCEIYECLHPVDICVYANGTHKRGTYFTSDHCELCVCNKNITVECTPSCPEDPPALPLTSIICRNPHYRLVDCCKTIFCQSEHTDLMSAIRNVYATSYTPHSITVTFDAMKQRTEEEEGQLFTDFQLHFADAEESSFPNNWTSKYVHLTPVAADEAKSPALLFEKSDSFLVDNRAYITLAGLLPNTTYFFKIMPVISNSGNPNDASVTDITTQPPNPQALLAVKTLAKYLTCKVDGKIFKNEESYVDECERDCTCRAGEVTCQNNCPQINAVMMPSTSCPKPFLEKKENQCCPSWSCHPKENGCRYGIAILQHGEQIREGCEKVCTCETGAVKCRPVCNDTTEPPRPGCRQQQIPNHCCKAWMCPPDKRPVKSIEAVLRTSFDKDCLEPLDSFKTSFHKELAGLVHDRCRNMVEPHRTVCLEADIVLHCAHDNANRRRRSINTLVVDIGISVSGRSDESSVSSLNESLDTVVDGISEVLNNSQGVKLNINSVQYRSSGLLVIRSLQFACDEGYSFYKDNCVRTEILNKEPSFNLELMPLAVGPDTAVLGWHSLDKIGLTHVVALQIEYREDNYTTWNQTSRLQPHVTKHTLTQLESESYYRARLVALTNLGYRPIVPTRDIVFKTKAFSVTSQLSLSLENVQVGQTSVTIRWRPLPREEIRSIKSMEVNYYELTHPLAVNTESAVPSLNACTITSLKSATNYVAVINIIYHNGTSVQSGTIHFITDSSDKSSSLTIPLAVSAVILVCAIIIVSVTCCMWRKARLKNVQDTAFENKVFGIQIHNDGRTLSART